jgi:uncharacterized LabA/DUF88 family protein
MSKNIQQTIDSLKNIRAGNIAPLYIYATEQISKYYSKLDLKQKKILTIIGSGDQAFNAFFYGAKEVVCFDINQLSKHIFYLKQEAIKNLSYLDFISYFGDGVYKTTLKYNIYNKFKHQLPKSTKQFFDSAYSNFNNSGFLLYNSPLFTKRECHHLENNLKTMNVYLRSEKNYLQLQAILKTKNIKLIISDLYHLKNKLTDKFDIINISNIPNFIFKILNHDYLKLKIVFRDLKELLNKKGVVIWYTYSKHTYPNRWGDKPPILSFNKNVIYLAKLCKVKYTKHYFKTIHHNNTKKGFDKSIFFYN